jgi:AcrR family transcriptional regulator
MSEQRTRRRRADGEQARRRILDAATEIAAERGYDGTSIAAVSARCGLPASSIYWQFADKDELIAAVIERSFERWLAAVPLLAQPSEAQLVEAQPSEAQPSETEAAVERVTAVAVAVAKALLETPDFLRLGLMLALERRPAEPAARIRFLQTRHVARSRIGDELRRFAPALADEAVQQLTTYALAGADGLFIAHEIGDDGDLIALFEMHARALVDAIARELATSGPQAVG